MRKPMVTRTIKTSEIEVLCVDIEKSETVLKTVTLPRTYKDEKTILKRLDGNGALENLKPVHVVSVTVNDTLYGMSEDEFITNAQVLPPRTTDINE